MARTRLYRDGPLVEEDFLGPRYLPASGGPVFERVVGPALPEPRRVHGGMLSSRSVLSIAF